jgi:hypothetical protein
MESGDIRDFDCFFDKLDGLNFPVRVGHGSGLKRFLHSAFI